MAQVADDAQELRGQQVGQVGAYVATVSATGPARKRIKLPFDPFQVAVAEPVKKAHQVQHGRMLATLLERLRDDRPAAERKASEARSPVAGRLRRRVRRSGAAL